MTRPASVGWWKGNVRDSKSLEHTRIMLSTSKMLSSTPLAAQTRALTVPNFSDLQLLSPRVWTTVLCKLQTEESLKGYYNRVKICFPLESRGCLHSVFSWLCTFLQSLFPVPRPQSSIKGNRKSAFNAQEPAITNREKGTNKGLRGGFLGLKALRPVGL